MNIEPIPVSATRAILGEGPVWWQGKLLWVDIEGRKVLTHDPGTGADRAIALSERVGCVWPCAGSDRLLCGLESGFAFLDPATAALEPIGDPESHLPRTRVNDGKCDPVGRFWAGTMDMDESDAVGSLYMLDRERKVTRQWSEVTVSNGLAWDPGGATLYYIDSPTREVSAFDYDATTGGLSNRRVIVALADGEGFPDGMTIDAEGCLWVALWQGWGVRRYSPRTGECLGKIDVPVEKVTSCTFGGAALDELYITTARIGLSDQAATEQPLAGALFKAKVDVAGLSTIAFRDQ